MIFRRISYSIGESCTGKGLLGTEVESAAGSGLVAVRIVGEQQPGAKQERQSQVDQMVIRSNVGTIQIETEKGRLIHTARLIQQHYE